MNSCPVIVEKKGSAPLNRSLVFVLYPWQFFLTTRCPGSWKTGCQYPRVDIHSGWFLFVLIIYYIYRLKVSFSLKTVGDGFCAEKVRTYNFPQNRVTDHQVGLTLKKLDVILSGELGEIVQSLQEKERCDRRQRPLYIP